jgi:hypothetical protein
LLVAAACAVTATGFVAVPAASAYVPIPGTDCILRAEKPHPTGAPNKYVVEGEVDCGGLEATRIEVCSQVHNANGKWYTVSGSCKSSPWGYIQDNYEFNEVQGVEGHEYRTWDKGWVEPGGHSEVYESSGYTCGCYG